MAKNKKNSKKDPKKQKVKSASKKSTSTRQADIRQPLLDLHKSLRSEIMEKWNRSVSFADQLFDRWDRAKFMKFDEGSSVYDACLILGDVKVGKQTWIGPYTVIDGRGGLKIGSFCSISSGVQIYSHDTVKWALTGGKAPEERSPTSIGDCCYVGPMSIISKGVTMGDHSVLGANSFLNKDLPAYSIAVGNPAKVIGKIKITEAGVAEFVYSVK